MTAGPVRMCVICRRRFPKQSLRRHVVGPNGEIDSDGTQTRPGRGFYVCSDEACLKKFVRYRPRGKAKKADGKRDKRESVCQKFA